MWTSWEDSQRISRTILANDQGGFLWGCPPYQRSSLTVWVNYQSKGHVWDQGQPCWMNVWGEAGGCHRSRNIFRTDCVHSYCWVAVSYCSSFSCEASSTFKVAYSTCTHFLQHSLVDFCFFATELVRYDFRRAFQPALCIALSVQVTVDDWYFQVGHLKKGCRVLQFGAYVYSQTLDNIKFHDWNFYLMFLFCKTSRHWSDYSYRYPILQECKCCETPMIMQFGSWSSACHRWWKNLRKPQQAVPVHWAIPSLLHCFVSQGAKILPSLERNKIAIMTEGPVCPCATGCSVVCFASGWSWNQSNWLDVQSD